MMTRDIYLQESSSGNYVVAKLYDEVSDKHLAMWNATWKPAMDVHCKGRVLVDSPEDYHWDWKWKANAWRPLLKYHFYSIVCRGELQGLMLANDTTPARLPDQTQGLVSCGASFACPPAGEL